MSAIDATITELMHAAMMPDDALKAKVLAEVNAVRAEWMMEPLEALPKGRPSDQQDCVVARALKGGFGEAFPRIGETVWRMYKPIGNTGHIKAVWTHKASPEAKELIARFDRGTLSELIAPLPEVVA